MGISLKQTKASMFNTIVAREHTIGITQDITENSYWMTNDKKGEAIVLHLFYDMIEDCLHFNKVKMVSILQKSGETRLPSLQK